MNISERRYDTPRNLFFNEFEMGHILGKCYDLVALTLFGQTREMWQILPKTVLFWKMSYRLLN